MATDGPIGKANVELGATTTNLDATLAEAKAKTIQSVTETEKAVAAKTASTAAESPAASTEKAAKAAEVLADNTQKAGKEAATAGIQFAQLKAGLLALAGAATQLWDGIKGARSAGEDFGRTMRGVEDAFRTDIVGSLDAISQRREAILRTAREQKDALDAEIRQRGILQDLVAFATGDPEAESRRQKIEAETQAALKRLADTKKDAASARDEEAEAEVRAYGARRRLAIARAEDDAKIRIAAEIEANRIIEEDRVRRAAETMRELSRLQSSQFAQLRSELNGLFNTGGLEVGINRVGQLIETLIQKVGDNR
jgi:hypothetical protein